MTTVSFLVEQARIVGFDVQGHSGWGQEGEDIVCAAVTSAIRLVECTVNDVMGLCASVKIREKDAKISFTLNGEDVPMASGTTANLIHGIPEQIAAISSFSTLLPGDVIMTGTPNASGHLDPGDETIVHVEGIGDLRNVIVRA